MTRDELQAICDYYACASMEAAEALREALIDLRRELLGEEND